IVHVIFCSHFCFFFQAEDGIRDFHVTGVQTCALPIYIKGKVTDSWIDKLLLINGSINFLRIDNGISATSITNSHGYAYPESLARSEERRVGKECRSRWSRNS